MSRPAKEKLAFSQRLMLVLGFVFLLTEVFGGFLRWYLSELGLPWLIYLPKLMAFLVVLGVLLQAARRGRISRLLASILMAMGIYGIVGAYYTQNPVQAAFGVFVMIPLLLGLLMQPAVERLGDRLSPYLALLWVCAASGVVLDYFVEVPWQGLLYQVGDVEVTASREWWTYGVDRLAGFSRASYEVAGQLLYLALGTVLLSKRRALSVVVWLISGILIVLTTTKKTAGVFAVLTLLLPLIGFPLFSLLRLLVGRTIPWVVALIGITLPLSTLFVQYSLNLNDPVSVVLFASFEDRLTWTWPEAFQLLFEHGNTWLGRGIGGIGAAQSYFEPNLYRFADSLYLYLYVVFGVFAVAIIFLYVKAIAALAPMQSAQSRLMWSWAVAALMSGWATNGIEGAVNAMILGLTFAYAARGRGRARAVNFDGKFRKPLYQRGVGHKVMQS